MRRVGRWLAEIGRTVAHAGAEITMRRVALWIALLGIVAFTAGIVGLVVTWGDRCPLQVLLLGLLAMVVGFALDYADQRWNEPVVRK